jgi:hypothetical protein
MPRTKTDAQGRFAFPATPDGAAEDPQRPCMAIQVYVVKLEGYVRAEARIERDRPVDVRLVRGGTLAVRVFDPQGEPVGDARVQVVPTTHTGPASLDGVSSAARRMETDAVGAGETQLPTGRYRLRAHAQGFSPCVVDDVDVLEGERTETAVRLHVGLVVDVRVVGPEAEAVSGALVRLAGPLRSGGQARTDADGRCAVPGIAPPAEPDDYWGSMVFYQVEAPGFALRFGYRRLPGDGKTYELEIPLVRGVPVRLHVVDDAGAPLMGVEASLTLDDNAANALPSSITFTTDAFGWADLPRLGPRTYSVTLVRREAGVQYELIELVVGTEAIEREIVLARRHASLAGRVLLPDGTPAAGGRIGVVAADADRARRLTAGGGEIGADGDFLLGNLEGGRQMLVAAAPGFLPQWREIEVVAGQQREGYAFRLERRGRIRGRVLTWDDAPLTDAEVQMEVRIVTERGGRTMQTGTFLPIAATDAEGRFEILGVDDEPLKFTVRREGWAKAWPWPDEVRAGPEDAVFVMKPASEGTGMPLIARVLADGQPYEGKLSAAVTDPGGGNLMGTIPPVALGDGRYEVRIHFRAPGPYDLRLTAPGWRPFEVHGVEIRHRPPRPEVTVTLDRGATLELRVVDEEGAPWANHWLQYGMGQIKTDEHGVVALSGLEPGSLERLHVSDPADGRYTYVSIESVPVPGTLEVVMRRCGHVRVETPYLYSNVEHDLVFRALDSGGNVVDTHVHPVGRYGELDRTALGYLKIYADGTYRIVLETNGKQVETQVDARVGQAVDVTLDPR